MENQNLQLWKKVEKTNPAYTKKAKIGGHEITAISPQYQIKNVTEQFGIYGQTWGFKDIKLSYDLVDKLNLVIFKGVFFFPNGEFEIINSCKLYLDRALTMVDDNFAKKLETDTLTKAISKLGFNADIFLGKFDDIKYVNDMNIEFYDVTKERITEIKNKTFADLKELAKFYNTLNSMEKSNEEIKAILKDKQTDLKQV